MSRISNLSNLRIPHFNTWKTLWYEKDKNYSYLFFRDFQLYQYLKGLFYRLKMLTDDFYFENLINNCFFIKTNIYLYKFQIKKYFISFFLDQYLLYNFFLKKRKYLFFYHNLNCSSIFFYLFFLKQQSFFFFYTFSNFIFFSLNKRRRYVSLVQLNNRFKFNINPIKFKLKKNLSYFFSFYKLKKKKLFSFKKYLFYFFIRNLLFFFNLFSFNYIFFLFYFFYSKKIQLFKYNISFFININKKKNNIQFLYPLKENYRRELNRDIFDERTYYDFFFNFFLYFFILNIEKSIFLFTGNKCIFYPVFYYYKKFTPLLSAKLINDYVLFELEKGNNLYRIFKILQLYQLKEKTKLKQELLVDFNKELFYIFFNKHKFELKNKITFFKKMMKNIKGRYSLLFKENKKKLFSSFLQIKNIFEELYYNEVLAKKYPLIGIRIECNGPPKRGRQARLVAYHQIVKNYKLFGKMPNKSILADIDYYQSFARTKQGSIGIKVWIFFYSKTYDNNYKLISIV